VGQNRVKCLLHARSDAELEIWGARRKMELLNGCSAGRSNSRLAKR
jgi:hypothetical protein